jgi:hypothetical protein
MQPIEALVIVRAHEHEVVELAGHLMALHAAGDLRGCLLEGGERLRCRAIEHHADHHHHAGAQRPRIEQRHRGADQAGALEPVDAAQAGRRAQVHLRGERHIGERCVTLQRAEDGLVGAVELDARLGAQFCCLLCHA